MNRLLWLFLIVTRLRDRLRCPHCKAVGTYKLHAPTPGQDGRPWRWLCKWCGWYRGPFRKDLQPIEGLLCYPSKKKGSWAFFGDCDPDVHCETPEMWRRELMPNVWPWRG